MNGNIALTLPARDFALDWRRFNLVANYIAEYASYNYAHKDRAENVISSVFYELLEHMASISREDALLALRLAADNGHILFEIASSGVEPPSLKRHEQLVGELRRGDLDSWYRGILETEPEAAPAGGLLGLALIAHDYHADISTQSGDSGAVILRAALGQEEMNP
ncbi:MAG TPA: hypothetical protein VMV03_13455 [Spirochaetia bacterium]|nr:hypothetical protein [Spirochaetia bacterium]